jgi:hypothetical protein
LEVADDAAPDEAVHDDGEIRDVLPDDLNASEYVGPYLFPDNSRRRIPGYIYLGIAAICFVLWVTRGDKAVLVNGGLLLAAVLLGAMGVLCLTSGWKLAYDEKQALAKATEVVGWPIGHASAQMAWRGFRSRPIWRVLAYSTEDPPRRRAFVVIDAVDGREIEHLVEDNPEAWSESAPAGAVSAEK